MQTKTYPYGTQKRGTVLERTQARYKGQLVGILVLQDEHGEGEILVGTESAGEAGDTGTLEFKQGGPMGGYWHFTPDAKPGAAST